MPMFRIRAHPRHPRLKKWRVAGLAIPFVFAARNRLGRIVAAAAAPASFKKSR